MVGPLPKNCVKVVLTNIDGDIIAGLDSHIFHGRWWGPSKHKNFTLREGVKTCTVYGQGLRDDAGKQVDKIPNVQLLDRYYKK